MSDVSEQITQVRARLADMQAPCEAAPAMMLRLVAHAEDVLHRHAPYPSDPSCCSGCESEDSQPVHYPCPEVAAVIQAWLP